MKKTFQILALACLIAFNTNAKSQKGVYMTASDYINKNLSYEKDSRIRLNNSVLEMPYITVIDHGNKVRLEKNAIYGYADIDNKVHRFYKNAEYLIAESGKITIYIQVVHIAQSKGYKVKKNFYFSTSPDAAIMPLNIDNLKNVYRSNEKFVDLLDQFFGNSDVTAYDRIHNTYKVNYVYAKAFK